MMRPRYFLRAITYCKEGCSIRPASSWTGGAFYFLENHL